MPSRLISSKHHYCLGYRSQLRLRNEISNLVNDQTWRDYVTIEVAPDLRTGEELPQMSLTRQSQRIDWSAAMGRSHNVGFATNVQMSAVVHIQDERIWAPLVKLQLPRSIYPDCGEGPASVTILDDLLP